MVALAPYFSATATSAPLSRPPTPALLTRRNRLTFSGPWASLFNCWPRKAKSHTWQHTHSCVYIYIYISIWVWLKNKERPFTKGAHFGAFIWAAAICTYILRWLCWVGRFSRKLEDTKTVLRVCVETNPTPDHASLKRSVTNRSSSPCSDRGLFLPRMVVVLPVPVWPGKIESDPHGSIGSWTGLGTSSNGRGSKPMVLFGVGATPVLEPILVGIGMFTGGTRFWLMAKSLMSSHLSRTLDSKGCGVGSVGIPPTILEAHRRVLHDNFPFGKSPVHLHE